MKAHTSQRLDLWSPVIPDTQQHSNFKGILGLGSQAGREIISSWADGFADRDGKFVREFQSTFDSSFWELYLFACFKELGFEPDLSHHAPDFMLSIGEAIVAAEATIAREADGHRPEWDKYDLIKSHDITELAQRVRYTTVRLASRFVSKVQEYRTKYANLAHMQGKPFLLCLAPFDQPFTFDLAQQAMRRVLYRADQPIFERDSKTGEARLLGVSEVDSVMKDSGVEFPLGMFCDDRYAEVSAVLFSTTATWSKVRALSRDPEEHTLFRAERHNAYGTIPLVTVAKKPQYRETLLDGLTLCLNPYAANPFDISSFLNREIAIDSWHHESQSYISNAPHEWLIRRFCFTARPTTELTLPPRSSAEYKTIATPAWPDSELRQLPAIMWPASTNWMAHFEGWTIVVLQDGIDGTWHGFAVEQIAHTIPEVREINKRGIVRSVWRMDDHATREEAFVDIKNAVLDTTKAKYSKKSPET
jgi:hypothetical protein